MKSAIIIILGSLSFFVTFAEAATIKNADTKPFSFIVQEGNHKRPLIVAPNQQIEICDKGCFLTLDSGDKYALLGEEAIDIVNGKLTFH